MSMPQCRNCVTLYYLGLLCYKWRVQRPSERSFPCSDSAGAGTASEPSTSTTSGATVPYPPVPVLTCSDSGCPGPPSCGCAIAAPPSPGHEEGQAQFLGKDFTSAAGQ